MTPNLHIVREGREDPRSAIERLIAHRAAADEALASELGDVFASADDLIGRLSGVDAVCRRSHPALADAAAKTAVELRARFLNLQDLAAKR